MSKYHVLPLNDLQEHEEAIWCACKPKDVDNVIVHNAYDNREIIEQAESIIGERDE